MRRTWRSSEGKAWMGRSKSGQEESRVKGRMTRWQKWQIKGEEGEGWRGGVIEYGE
jgi:streptogramin lyase